MKNLKKVIALVAVFALVFTTVTAFASSFVDVDDNANYIEAVEALNKLGIITGDTNDNGEPVYRPDDSVTRAEMAALVSRMQAFNASSQSATPFTDVPTTHWASGYVAAAAQTGIVNGYGDGTFGPEDPVLYEQVIKMVMVTLGYEPFAAANGGYPTGYTIAASRYDVTKDVTGGVPGQPAPRATIAQIIYNAIDTPIMEPYYYGTGSENYVIYDGLGNFPRRTLLSQNLKVTKLRGQLIDNGITDINNNNVTIDTDEERTVSVRINGVYNTDNSDYADFDENDDNYIRDYLAGDSGIEKYIGQQIVLYVKADETKAYPEVISAAPEAGKNKVESFTVDKFDKVEQNNNTDVIRYYRNDTDRTSTKCTLQEGYHLIYNNVGGYLVDAVFGEGQPVQKDSKVGGKVTLYDTDSVSGYDVVIVEVAATAVVDSVDGNLISFKNSPGESVYRNAGMLANISVDENDSSQIINITKDGADVAYTDLAEWDVLSVICNEDFDNYYDIRVISNVVEGTISTQSGSDTSDTGYKYRIGDGTYDVAVGAYEADGLEPGDAGLFYIDEYGKIAAYSQDYSASTGNGNYAYIIKAVGDTDDFGNKTLTIKMLTAKDGIRTWNVASNLTIRDHKNSTKANEAIFGTADISRYKVKDDDTLGATANALTGQVIKYSTNSSSQISAIELVADNDDDSNHLSLMYDYGDSDVTYEAEDQRFVGSRRTFVGENAIVFFVNGENDDNAEVGTIADIADNETYNGVSLYDEESEGPKLIVIDDENAATGISTSSSAIVIEGVGTTTNSEGTVVTTLSYYQDGTLKDAMASETINEGNNVSISEYNEGDMALISLNANGEIKSIKPIVMFDSDYVRDDATPDFPTGQIFNNDTKNVTDEGVAVKKSGSRITITDANGGNERSYNISGANVYVYDVAKARNNLTVGSTGSVLINQTLLNGSSFGKDDDLIYNVYTNDYGTIAETPAYALCDYVYVRTYEDDVIDVLVIKAADFGTLRYEPK